MHAAAFATHFLAQASAPAATLDAANPTVFMGLLMAAIFTLVAGANQVDSMIQRRKRTPPIESEFVTKQEFRDALARIESEAKITRISVEKLSLSLTKEFNGIWRALGKMEGVTLEDRSSE